MNLKERIFSLRLRYYPSSISDEEFISHLHNIGVECGSHTKFFEINNIRLDTTRPWLLKIGDYCKITGGVIILTHDYSRSVLRRVYGEVIGEAKKTIIGDNCFIGMNSILLMGTVLGDNVIVGAGSVVHGNIPSNSVVAGNPARVICSLEEYYEKRKKLYIDEARECAISYKEKYGEYPSLKTMGAFFPIYLKRERFLLKKYDIFTRLSGDDEEEIIERWLQTEPIYNGYNDFLKTCR